MKNRKGFTLIELLAVIVILGLLMAIAIPSVTKYITESRKKTLTTTVGNYIGALVNEVNDLSYTFTGQNTIYAVPIECISLERGGTNPFGQWYQANDNYFAYVLIQYDDQNSKYIYGFTFKDSAGYGLYPTIQPNINENGKQIKTDIVLNRPKTGDLTSLTTLAKWQESGFKVDSNTTLSVLIPESEGVIGDGISTCTLAQKRNNYEAVEREKEESRPTIVNLIKKHNTIIEETPNLKITSGPHGGDKGFYMSTDTDSGKATYYFRGAIRNNYVLFGDIVWRIVRINEDGSVRLIIENNLEDGKFYNFTGNKNDYRDCYYSRSTIAKNIVEDWYYNNIYEKGLDGYVVEHVFCEAARVKSSSLYQMNKASLSLYSSYTPTFKCQNDRNGYGIVNSKVGLLSYDEVVFAGAYPGETNSMYYLHNNKYFWTMSPVGWYSGNGTVWYVGITGVARQYISANSTYRPVININGGLIASGTGTIDDMYVISLDDLI